MGLEMGREGFLLAKYHAKLLLIGCTAWFANLLEYCCCKHINIFERRSSGNSQQHIAYSAGHCLFNQLQQSGKGNRVDLLQDGGDFKKLKEHRPWSLTIPNICYLPDPPAFSMVPTFKKSLRTHMKINCSFFPRYNTHEEEINHIFFFLTVLKYTVVQYLLCVSNTVKIKLRISVLNITLK